MTADRPWAGLLALGAALLIWSPRDAVVGQRARALRSSLTAPSRAGLLPESAAAATRRRWLLAGASGAAVGLLLGGAPGVVVAVGVAVGGERLLRRAAPDPRHSARPALVRDLPVACDLLGIVLAAGLPVGAALAAAGGSLPEPLGPELRGVAALYRLGAEPRHAWADVPPELAGLGRVIVRAGESGSAVAVALRALADESRATARASADAAVRRAGVWLLAPLGACFLPAFLCLGVVPLVLGIAADVFR